MAGWEEKRQVASVAMASSSLTPKQLMRRNCERMKATRSRRQEDGVFCFFQPYHSAATLCGGTFAGEHSSLPTLQDLSIITSNPHGFE